MARKTIKRSSIFTFVAVIALLGLGVGYAAWTGQLTVNSSATTANANVQWQAGPTAVENDPYSLATSTCTATRNVDTNINWDIVNAYPGYSCTITIVSENNGTVPMEVSAKTFSPTITQISGPLFSVTGQPGVTLDFTGCATAPGRLDVGDVLGVGQTGTCSFIVSFDSATLENDTTTYDGSATIDFVLP